MSDEFYRRFEEAHRGPRELIKKRLHAYAPFTTPLAEIYPGGVALDLGCGRGEWLEVAQEHGFTARGVDLDEGMLAAARERGLGVEAGDAIAALAATPDASVAVVSAFHLVEHISFDQVRTLVVEALRVLQPGGLLILETPNAENPWVGLSSFYLDPSHLRPLPQALLQFVTDDSGYARTHVVRLQESPEVATTPDVALSHVLFGPSPDYAVVAQKSAAADQLALFDAAFGRAYGIGLEALASRFDQRVHGRFEMVAHSVDSVEQKLSLVRGDMEFQHDCLRSHDARLNELRERLERLSAYTESVARRSAEQAEQLAQMHQSLSWRITAPLRAANHRARLLLRGAMASPALRRAAGLVLKPFPRLRARIFRMAYSANSSHAAQPVIVPEAMREKLDEASDGAGGLDVSQLTPRARQIYHALNAAITKD